MFGWLLTVLGGCCGSGPPRWFTLEPLLLTGGSATVDLAGSVIDDRPDAELVLTATSGPDVIADLAGTVLTVTPQPGWLGATTVHLVAEDACGNVAEADLQVESVGTVTTPGGGGACEVTFSWTSPNAPTGVSVAGSFNDWATDRNPMTWDGGGWTLSMPLPVGAHAYKFVERTDGPFGTTEAWTCDPLAESIVCEAGYKDPAAIGFAHECVPGAASCNSLVVVEGCVRPRVEADEVYVDPTGLGLHLRAVITPGAAATATVEVTLDGSPAEASVDADAVTLDVGGLAPGRHTARVAVTDAAGNRSDDLYVPFWLDGRSWTDTVMYFAFVDRMRNGDPTNDAPTGATGSDYEGGDLQGLIDLLPYLDDLGVGTLWVSNLQDNAAGAWGGDCDLTYSGYHAYWPTDARGVEEHFGDAALVEVLVDQAHARGMRVVMDLVANHVHEQHPYYVEHPEWFNDYAFCKDSVNGQLNFDRIPETCWFAPYLPDFDYGEPEPLAQLVSDAEHWVKQYELDGYRVDAVKHMPYAVPWDLRAMIDREIDHVDAGGERQFYTVGETFDGAERIASYVGPHGLDGQFDFPLYYTMRDVFARNQGELVNALYAFDASRASFGDAPMSTFLGNHDVPRFVTDAWVGGGAGCVGTGINVAPAPGDAWPYDRLKLGFTFLLTMPGIPLVYYGDELGLPGNADPDNRQPLAWHAGDLAGAASVEDVAGRVGPNQASVVRHLRALIRARNDHPALRYGGWTEWWREPDLLGYTRSSDGDHALVVLNRSDTPRTLTNGVSFAGLPQGTYVDAITQQGFPTAGDSLTVSVDPRSARVLILEAP